MRKLSKKFSRWNSKEAYISKKMCWISSWLSLPKEIFWKE
jgi:hypothetical protein